MKRIVYLSIALIIAGSILLGCEGDAIEGSGDLITIEKDYMDFTGVDLAHSVKASIIRSDSYKIVVMVDDNIEEYLNIKKVDDTLKIYLNNGNHYKNITIEAQILMPYLDNLELSGASRAEISGFVSDHNLDMGISGASKVSGDITAGNVDIILSGASRISLDGNGKDTNIQASGASDVDMRNFMVHGDADIDLSGASNLSLEGNGENLKLSAMGASDANLEGYTTQNADIHLSGASNGEINLTAILNAELSGASKLRYYGNPTMGNIETSGASSIKPVD